MIKDMIRSWCDERWNIGIINTPLEAIMRGEAISVSWIVDPMSPVRWFADPFILSYDNDKIIILAEEMFKPRGQKIGRISRLCVDRQTYTIQSASTILELPTHLSFPAIFRLEPDRVLIYPENSESGELFMYEYDDVSQKCVTIGSICKEPVADAIAVDINGELNLFATVAPKVNGNCLRQYIYSNKDKQFYYSQSYYFEENIARMAGDFFEYNGNWYRPAQESNTQYGHAVVIQKMSLTKNEILFSEVRRIYSAHPKLKTGCHTFNMFGDLIVTDALGFDNMWFRKILKFLHLLR